MSPPLHRGEWPADAALVKRLLATHFPRWADAALQALDSGGTDHHLFRLGRSKLVRLPRLPAAAERLAAEADLLAQLATAVPALPLAVPRVLALAEPSTPFPARWAVQRWLPGRDAASAGAAWRGDSGPARRAAEALAAFLRALHAQPATGLPLSARSEPLAQRDGATREALAKLADWALVDRAAALALWERALCEGAASPGTPCLIHGDLLPGNVLHRAGQPVAVIDWSLAGLGDPAVDLLAAWNLFGPVGRVVLREALAIDEATWLRGQGWALSQAAIYVPYYRHGRPAGVAHALWVLAELGVSQCDR